MGNKINPTLYRLGVSADWQYQIKDPLLSNIFLYKAIKKLFWNDTAPYIQNIRRRKNHRNLNLITKKDKFITNLLLRTRYIFSHLNISYSPSLNINIFLHDFIAEKERAKKRFPERSFFYLTGYFDMPYGRNFSHLLKNTFRIKAKNPVKKRKVTHWYYYKKMLRSLRTRSRFFYSRALLKVILKYKKKKKKAIKRNFEILKKKHDTKLNSRFAWKKHLKKKRCDICQKHFKLLALKKKKRNRNRNWKKKYTWFTAKAKYNNHIIKPYPIWLANNIWLHQENKNVPNIIKNLKISKFLLRYFKFFNKIYSKKKIFLFNILIIVLKTILTFNQKHMTNISKLLVTDHLKFNTLTKKIFLFLHLSFINLLSYNYFQLRYNQQTFQKHLVKFYALNKIILFTIKKVAFMPMDNKLITRFYLLGNLNLNSLFLMNYFITKLDQYFDLKSILNPINRRLKQMTIVEGFRIIFSGRLTRKERAEFVIRSYKSMPSSHKTCRIDYASDFAITNFGVVGIKIYLLLSGQTPYHYFCEFKSKL